MTIKTSPILIAFFSLILISSCSEKSEFTGSKQVLISGSDSEALISRALIEAYKEQNGHNSAINLISTGTSQGISDFINGECQVANASRPMNFNERRQAKANGINPVEVIIAYDAVGIITNPRLGVDSLSIDEIRLIYTGKIKNWKSVGGPDLEIQCYGRAQGSGTREYIETHVLHSTSMPTTISMTFTEEIIEAVENNLNAIGYVGVGYIMEDEGKPLTSIWPMNIYSEDFPATSPWEKYKIQQGKYPLCRYLLQYFNGFPEGESMDFLQFELSSKGQKIINSTGYFSLTEEQKTLNLQNGILCFADSIPQKNSTYK